MHAYKRIFVSMALCIKSNYAPTLYTDSFFTQNPTLWDLGKGWLSPQDSKQEIILLKYMKTLYG